jgi:hypothetical protein
VRVTGPAQPVHFLLDIIDVLNEFEVPYSVIGALAVSLHGIPRSTNDGDLILWLNDTAKTVKEIKDRLTAQGYVAGIRMFDMDDPVRGVLAVQDQHSNSADLLLGIRGMDPDAQGRSTTADLRDTPISFLGAEDIVAMKLFAGSHQDIHDARGIIEVSKEKIDLDLLRRLARRYGSTVAEKLEKVLSLDSQEHE